MRSFWARIGAVTLLSTLTGSFALAQGPAPPRFRSGVELVPLDVCVTDREGRFLPALSQTDFLVFDDRVPQRLTFFSAEGALPVTAVVLIDRSSSMAGPKLARAKDAALTLLQHLGPKDVGEVLAFSEHAQRVVPFDADANAARTLIGEIDAAGSTALFDAVLVGLRELETARRPGDGPRREALVVLSDGEDTASHLAFEDVHGDLQRAGVIVYSISIRMDAFDQALPPTGEFGQLAHDSGGRVVVVRDLTTLDAVYADIAAELRHMYRLAYVPATPAGDRRWHVVSVRVLNRDARIRTRAGYYARKPSPQIGEQR